MSSTSIEFVEFGLARPGRASHNASASMTCAEFFSLPVQTTGLFLKARLAADSSARGDQSFLRDTYHTRGGVADPSEVVHDLASHPALRFSFY